MEKVRMAIIGLGNRGYGNMQAVMSFDDVQITAVCDVYTDRAERAAAKAEEKYGVRPFSTTDYREVLTRSDVDCVMIATAWESHVPIAIDTMRAGKPVALEVGGAYSAEDCHSLVRTYEETETPFLFLENCCYDRTELLVTAMARKGLIGEIVHCSGAYGHDLREEILHGKENRHYRLRNYIHRNCENYPTHELGPIAKLLISSALILRSQEYMTENSRYTAPKRISEIQKFTSTEKKKNSLTLTNLPICFRSAGPT